jgi:hypothetical protein
MDSFGLATQHDLRKWADSVAARSELPRLIRRLVLETAEDLASVDFPAGEGVSVGGWDGVVQAGASSPFVPDGLSLWELSVESSVNTKADDDYAKRTATPDGSATGDATYCQLAVRRWADRREWQKTKTKEGRWRAVRAFGLDDLETWLEDAPVTHAWISEQLGLTPYGLRTADAWWRPWAQATNPTLTPEIVLAGRGQCTNDLVARLRGEPQVISMRADSPEEALACIAAVALQEDAAGAGDLLARVVFVDQLDTWRRLADSTRPVILVPRTSELIDEVQTAPGHHVIVPLTTAAVVDVELPPMDASEVASALKEAGVPDDRAGAAGTLGRRSLLALRRHLATKPELLQPSWARPPVSRLIRGCLLAGSWHDDAPGDRDALARFVGKDYEEIREELEVLAADADPLVVRVGSTWSVVSLFDAWRQLERQLRSDDLDRFQEICIEVLTERDPRAGLARTDLMMASLRGLPSRRYSGDLRNGLAASLALLGVAGDRVLAEGVANGSSYAQRIVRQILSTANEDESGELLGGLAPQLQLLAEAAPDVFVEAIRTSIRGENPVAVKLFQDREDSDPLFSGGSPHTSLLWALETLAWSPDHFAEAMYLLAGLAELDPGGRFINRPGASLREILCPWHPETAAGVDRRLAVLEELVRRYPEVAWPLLLGLLPQMHGVHHPSSGPRFRDWKPDETTITQREYWTAIDAITDMAIGAAGTQADRWAALVDKSDALPSEKRRAIFDGLKAAMTGDGINETDRRALWEKLRAHVARHCEFSQAKWALPDEELAPLDEVIATLAPTDSLVAWTWLFVDGFPDLGDGLKNRGDEGYDHAAYTVALGERRRRAIAEILEQHGFEGAVRLAEETGAGWWVGSTLAEVAPDAYHAELVALLEADDRRRMLSNGYFARTFAEKGWSELDVLIKEHAPSPIRLGRLLLCAEASPDAWKRAGAAGPEVTAVYWGEFSPYGLGRQFAHTYAAVRNMLDHGSVVAALQMLALYVSQDEDDELAPLVVEALDRLLNVDASERLDGRLREYDLTTLFDFLERHRDVVGLDDVARLEWAYLPALGFEPNAPTLHEALAQSPSFFMSILEIVYRPSSGGTDEPEASDEPEAPNERRQELAENGYRLLDSWHRPPGQDADGVLDGEALQSWVDEVLTAAKAIDRRRSAESQIGRVLRYAAPEEDGAWPPEPVRDLLERLDSDRIDEALATEVYNSRGATSRNPTDGGKQERVLAERYREHVADFADRWPRSAALLRGIAEEYEVDARRHDAEAERLRKGLDR